MTLVAPPLPRRFTPDDLLELNSDHLCELVDGQLVEKQTSALSAKTATIITVKIGSFLEKSPVGDLYTELTFRCFPDDPDLIRRPDISFIVASRLAGVPEEGHVRIPPDLAIEVVSPGDRIYDLDDKLANYFSAGVKLVWLVNPKRRTLRIHYPDHISKELQESDTLSGESVLPGFSITVKDLLPPKPAKPLPPAEAP